MKKTHPACEGEPWEDQEAEQAAKLAEEAKAERVRDHALDRSNPPRPRTDSEKRGKRKAQAQRRVRAKAARKARRNR